MQRPMLIVLLLLGGCSSSGALIDATWPASLSIDTLEVETSISGKAPSTQMLGGAGTAMANPYRLLVHSPEGAPLVVGITAFAKGQAEASGRLGVTPDANDIVRLALELKQQLLCGNGQLDPGEECDDGNRNDNDGCPTGCTGARCGDGVLYLFASAPPNGMCAATPIEACDDGNNIAGDGCSPICERE